MKQQVLLLASLLFMSVSSLLAQGGYISGDLELRNDYYVRDTLIGAGPTPQYDNLKSSIDSWLTLNYTNPEWGFDAGVRLDGYLNSNLHNPGTAYSGIGIGRWHLRKTFQNLTLTGGYFYDQFGSGMVFRSYEERFFGIDNAIFGLHGSYQVKDFLTIKAFGGVRKNRLGFKSSFIKGANMEYFKSFDEKNVTIIPGISVLNRTMNQEDMDELATLVNSYAIEDRFVPKYNNYVFSAYNTLTYKNFSWFIEAGYKSPETQFFRDNTPVFQKAGTAILTTLSYSKKGFGITGQFKRTENFQIRNSPLDNDLNSETFIRGALNFVPPINKQNSLRLPSRYLAGSFDLDEMGVSFDVSYKINKKWKMSYNFSQLHSTDVSLGDFVNDLISVQRDISGLRNFDNSDRDIFYYKENYLDFNWRRNKKLKGMFGFQYVVYNRDFYEGPSSYPKKVFAYSPFMEITHNIDRKKSLRYEFQYQHAANDFGQWAYALVEFNFAPSWSISVSDMWNVKSGSNDLSIKRSEKTGKESIIKNTGLHYFSVLGSFTKGRHRISAAYVKQVAGIVCTGGVCRFEPAFNGVRLNLLTSF